MITKIHGEARMMLLLVPPNASAAGMMGGYLDQGSIGRGRSRAPTREEEEKTW
jgi:hypothetical protein